MALTKEQHLLTKLAEEGSEISQIALKSVQFTLNEIYQDQTVKLSNRQRIHDELNDLLGVVRMLNRYHGFGYVLPDIVNDHGGSVSDDDFLTLRDKNNKALLYKEEKINHYKSYSQELGTVENE